MSVHPFFCSRLFSLTIVPPIPHKVARTMSLVNVLDRESESEVFDYGEYSQLPWGARLPPPPGASWYPRPSVIDKLPPPNGARGHGQTGLLSEVGYRSSNDPLPTYVTSSSAAIDGATPRLHTGGVSDSRSFETSDGLAFQPRPPKQSSSRPSNSNGWRAGDQSGPEKKNSTSTSWLASGRRASTLRQSGRKLLPGSESFRTAFFTCFASQELARCSLAIETSISTFLEVELTSGASLWDLVVLAMSGESAWATTCQGYISQTWPASSDRIKVLIDHLARPGVRHLEAVNLSSGTPEITEQETCIDAQDGCPPFKLQAKPGLLADLVEALAWISAVTTETFATEPQVAQICVWITSLEPGEPTILIGHDDYSPMKMLETSSDCWKRLFPHGMVPGGFPVPSRDDAMQGLELSFDLMCYLCGLEYETSDASGLVLRGHRSLVYPVRKAGDCVQWHFQHLDFTDHSKPQEETINEHLKNVGLDELQSAGRHFLGLWATPEITLGTDRVDYASLTWSNQAEVRETMAKDGVEIGGSIIFPKILNITLNKTYKIANCQRNIYMVDFEGKLQSLANFPVILYSPSEKRAWLVSYVSVILHLARARAHHQRTLGYYVPACTPAADGGSSALRTIMRHCRESVKRTSSGVYQDYVPPGMTVQDYVNEVWAALDKVTLETCRAKRLFRNQIIGYEAADIAKLKTTLRMKRKDLGMFSNSWTPLLSEIKLALFYEGISDPILAQPSGIPDTHCCSWLWRQTPKGFDLLTASLPCLVYLSEHLNGSGPTKRLTEDYSWHCPGELQLLFCDKKSRHVCNRLQEVRRLDWRSYNILHPRSEELTKYPHGAVLFKDSVNQATIHASLAAIASSQESTNGVGHRDRGSFSSTKDGSSRRYHHDWQADGKRTSQESSMPGQPPLEIRPPRSSPGTGYVAPAATQLQVWHDPNDEAEGSVTEPITDSERSRWETHGGLASSKGNSGWGQPVMAAGSRRRRRYSHQQRPPPDVEHQLPRSPRVEPLQYGNSTSDITKAPSNEPYLPPPPTRSRDINLTGSWQRPREETQPTSEFYGRNDGMRLAVPVISGHHSPVSEDSYYDRPSVSSHTSNDQRNRTHPKAGKNHRARREAQRPTSSCVFL